MPARSRRHAFVGERPHVLPPWYHHRASLGRVQHLGAHARPGPDGDALDAAAVRVHHRHLVADQVEEVRLHVWADRLHAAVVGQDVDDLLAAWAAVNISDLQRVEHSQLCLLHILHHGAEHCVKEQRQVENRTDCWSLSVGMAMYLEEIECLGSKQIMRLFYHPTLHPAFA